MVAAGRSDRVFVDSSAYYAAASPRDASHRQAAATMEQLVASHHRLFTTNFILSELHALLLIRVGRDVAARALAAIDASATTTVVRVSARDECRAREIVYTYTDKDFSLTDAMSFAVMERLHITQAFSLDQHFAQFGWSVLPLDRAPR